MLIGINSDTWIILGQTLTSSCFGVRGDSVIYN